ncbi:hypothetical protein F5B20DRAFT_576813 [Whalleya microplaca]|nr:hypothetical protein F5B20DRAFT_576813 [Whalleya microplaca]
MAWARPILDYDQGVESVDQMLHLSRWELLPPLLVLVLHVSVVLIVVPSALWGSAVCNLLELGIVVKYWETITT